MREIVIIAHNIRSTHNVGSLLRTADGLGAFVYLTGYTPYPAQNDDKRLPHEAQKVHKQIQKTALGAESQPIWDHQTDINAVIATLKDKGFIVAALEQSKDSTPLPSYNTPNKLAIVLGEEINGVSPALIDSCDVVLEIPMFGQKESFNVAQTAAMALYHARFITKA